MLLPKSACITFSEQTSIKSLLSSPNQTDCYGYVVFFLGNDGPIIEYAIGYRLLMIIMILGIYIRGLQI